VSCSAIMFRNMPFRNSHFSSVISKIGVPLILNSGECCKLSVRSEGLWKSSEKKTSIANGNCFPRVWYVMAKQRPLLNPRDFPWSHLQTGPHIAFLSPGRYKLLHWQWQVILFPTKAYLSIC